MTDLIVARGLSKTFGSTRALDNVNFHVQPGRIVGLIGPNGAGKTTALKALLGLTRFDGELSVLGLDPYHQRHRLMQDVCFIADVAVLPRWIRVSQLIDFVGATHPRFRREVCEHFLARSDIKRTSRVRELSKGMVTQLHLALVMAIDAKLLVLDEPTLGLDILMRKQFYDTLLNEYFDAERTILVTTHQVEEIQHLLTDLLFIDHGRIVLDATMDDVQEKYAQVSVRPEHLAAARTHKPIGGAPGPRPHAHAVPRHRARGARAPGRSGRALGLRPLRRGHPGSARMNRFLWLVRREVWEHKAIWIAPAIVLGCVILLILTGHVHIKPFSADEMKRRHPVARPEGDGADVRLFGALPRRLPGHGRRSPSSTRSTRCTRTGATARCCSGSRCRCRTRRRCCRSSQSRSS